MKALQSCKISSMQDQDAHRRIPKDARKDLLICLYAFGTSASLGQGVKLLVSLVVHPYMPAPSFSEGVSESGVKAGDKVDVIRDVLLPAQWTFAVIGAISYLVLLFVIARLTVYGKPPWVYLYALLLALTLIFGYMGIVEGRVPPSY